ncbi:antistasin-like [Pomacea canaliculata]|uniref:antistasin-like n=1 Tax=Pomacea canaliculata TaxID=400727 RepID=UPI000D73F23E|nr:antistasin-like [Pomacea canaliculata]
MATKLYVVFVLTAVSFVCLTALRWERGSCLLLCGDGVHCPSGYSCKSNGCGTECFNVSFVQPSGCDPFLCDRRCPLGYKRDANGCQSCECDYSAIQITGK